jgi:hypothetical protein
MSFRNASKVSAIEFSFRLIGLGAAALCLVGCAGYRLGPVNGLQARDKSVQVNPFANRTLEPRLTDAVTSQIRNEFQRDATFRLASSDANIVVAGTLLSYDRHALSYSSGDTLTAKDYRLALRARVTATERGTGKVLLDKPVNGYTVIRVENDLTSTERQAMPLLAQDLARNVVGLLAEGSW